MRSRKTHYVAPRESLRLLCEHVKLVSRPEDQHGTCGRSFDVCRAALDLAEVWLPRHKDEPEVCPSQRVIKGISKSQAEPRRFHA